MTGSVHLVLAPDAPAPAGHYAQGVAIGNLVFASGQLPVTPDGMILSDAPFEAQVRQALGNLLAIVAAAGSSPRQVVRTTAYLVGIERWGALDALYAEAFGEHRPSRTVIPVPGLHHGCLFEVDGVAYR